MMKAEKKASGAGRFKSGKKPEWKPVFFTGLDNAPLKKSTCCGTAKESEEENQSENEENVHEEDIVLEQLANQLSQLARQAKQAARYRVLGEQNLCAC